MLRQINYIIETTSIFACIYCVYGEKLKIKRRLLMTNALVMLLMEIANQTGQAFPWSQLMQLVFVGYCILTFKRSIRANIINYILYTIVITATQCIFVMGLAFLIKDEIQVRLLLSNAITCVFSILVLPKFELHRIAEWGLKKNFVFYSSLAYLFAYICFILIQVKSAGSFYAEWFIFFTPFILFILLIFRQGAEYSRLIEQGEKELLLYKVDKQESGEYIKKLRARQHDINNHITAIMAMHYTKENYDDLVAAQNEYCNRITDENKLNSLLALHDSALMGFLYEKIKWIEGLQIEVNCRVCIQKYCPDISDYYVVEMMGILLDNSTEAVREGRDRRITIEICENEQEFEFCVSNPCAYVPYEEIVSWFEFSTSKKGNDRGIGLYKLKQICLEWNATICCENVELDGENWIRFKIGTGRKE